MKNTMEYKGYLARVEYSDDDGCFVGRLLGIHDVVGFHAATVAKLRAAFREAVNDYLETCAAVGKAPERPYSGKFVVRVAPEVHARVAVAAQADGKSLNQWIAEALDRAAQT